MKKLTINEIIILLQIRQDEPIFESKEVEELARNELVYFNPKRTEVHLTSKGNVLVERITNITKPHKVT